MVHLPVYGQNPERKVQTRFSSVGGKDFNQLFERNHRAQIDRLVVVEFVIDPFLPLTADTQLLGHLMQCGRYQRGKQPCRGLQVIQRQVGKRLEMLRRIDTLGGERPQEPSGHIGYRGVVAALKQASQGLLLAIKEIGHRCCKDTLIQFPLGFRCSCKFLVMWERWKP